MKAEKNGSGALTRAQILAASDLKIESVDVPEWGGTVFIRNLTGKTRDDYEASRYNIVGERVELVRANTRAALLARCLCDESGKLLFSIADVEALGEKNADALDRCFEVAQRLSGMRTKEIEDRVKNLLGAQSVNSGT